MDEQQRSLRLVEGYKVVLASNSPRRKELLAGLGIDFEVRTLKILTRAGLKTLKAKTFLYTYLQRSLKLTNPAWLMTR